MNPQVEEVIQLARQYNVIPITRTVMADTETPISLFQRLQHEPFSFLLESVEGGIQWARHSFIGTTPFLRFQGKNGKLIVIENGVEQHIEEKPLAAIKRLLRRYRSPKINGLPPLTGGAIGFFGYDLVQQYERLPQHAVDDMHTNDIQFMFCDQLVVFDHVRQQMQFIVNIHIQPDDTDEMIRVRYEESCQKLLQLQAKLTAPLPRQKQVNSDAFLARIDDIGPVRSNETKESFIAKVDQAKQYILAGDIFQVVLSQRFERKTTVDPLDVYRMLRMTNPSPYMYVLKMEDETIVGTSPEALVRVNGDRVETRPIAGTRPRGKTEEQDMELERELLADEKERAEHLMLVDLGRNDIGRVCDFGSVRCDKYMDIERYSHVMHIVSNVSGTLRKDKDFFDAFLSCLPAGTVSGAPKLRAMEIIAELEREARGAYAGAIGYLGFNGNMDTCITIRTIIFKGGSAYVQAGAGIVWDSVPEKEYEETVNKAKALLVAIEMAERVFSTDIADRVEAATVNTLEKRPLPVNWDYYVDTEMSHSATEELHRKELSV
ncbi:anthranilate synthase component I [Paenibacillus sp. 481]|uniref:anthranilate synthase component I n=1 Tax=Paenibacillus sp. 481 TaxID=2835869 RepID=UPI001E2DF20F|nr:anthranilate synthase component I [Paenibacillus sp. 481]UHA72967.1 anthranilate synthase component I [Paenibacillus sp. 481]